MSKYPLPLNLDDMRIIRALQTNIDNWKSIQSMSQKAPILLLMHGRYTFLPRATVFLQPSLHMAIASSQCSTGIYELVFGELAETPTIISQIVLVIKSFSIPNNRIKHELLGCSLLPSTFLG